MKLESILLGVLIGLWLSRKNDERGNDKGGENK